jgi:hypothetical protein
MTYSQRRISGFAITLAATLAGVIGPAKLAHAQDVAEKCSAAYEQTQRQRANGAFLEASQAAQVCSQAECNALIVQECIKLFEQLQQDTPSVVFSVRNGNGEELDTVQVQIDGHEVADHLDGRPIEMNPGLHTFRFEAPGLPPVETKQTARVGDRNRLMEIVLGDKRPQATEPKAAAPITSPTQPPPEPPRKAKIPVASIALGGVGLLGLGAFGYFRLSATHDYNEMGRTCSPRCNPDDTAKIHDKFQLSYIGLGVGAAAIGGAVLLLVVNRDRQGAPAAEVAVMPTYDGARAQWQTRF